MPLGLDCLYRVELGLRNYNAPHQIPDHFDTAESGFSPSVSASATTPFGTRYEAKGITTDPSNPMSQPAASIPLSLKFATGPPPQ